MQDKNKGIREAGIYLGLGSQLAFTVLLMLFIGYKIDEYFNSFPLFLVIFAFLGSFGGIYNFIKSVLNINRKKKSD